MKKKVLSFALCLCMLLALLPAVSQRAAAASAWDGTSDTAWYNDADTSFAISTAEQLAGLAKLVNGGNDFLGKTITLTADLDLGGVEESGVWSGKSWTPIGASLNNYFSGTFDGGGFSISNFYINAPHQEYTALFGSAYDATFKNVTISSGSVLGYYNVGSLIGYTARSTVESCVNTSDVKGEKNVGGIVGKIVGGVTVRSCRNTGRVEADYSVGGIVGTIFNGGDDCVIKSCYNTGAIKGNGYTIVGASSCYVGGVVGISSSSGITIANCYNTGSVTAQTTVNEVYVGGVVGVNFESPEILVTNCYNTGSLTCTSASKVGGVVGYNASSASVANCYYLSGTAATGIDGVTADAAGSTTGLPESQMKAAAETTDANWCDISLGGESKGKVPLVDALNAWVAEQTADDYCRWTVLGAFNSGYPTIRLSMDGIVGDGTEDVPYLIKTTKQLAVVAALTNSGESFKGKFFKQAADLDLGGVEESGVWSGQQWTPIGRFKASSPAPFSGTFDGGGFSISNLYIEAPSQNYIGLFGYTKYATIKDVTISSGSVVGNNRIGGVLGHSTSGRIMGCVNSASVKGRNTAGGVVGYNDTSGSTAEVTNCSNTGDVSGTGDTYGTLYIGGVIGHNRAYSSDVIKTTNCYNTGAVTGSIGSAIDGNVGGVVGRCHASDGGTTDVLNCYNTGEVIGTGDNVGGVVGESTAVGGTASVLNCYNNGDVKGANYVGGVVGQSYAGGGTANVENCYSSGAVDGTGSNVGGVAGKSHEVSGSATVKNCYWLKNADVNTNLNCSGSGITQRNNGYFTGLDGVLTSDGSGDLLGSSGVLLDALNTWASSYLGYLLWYAPSVDGINNECYPYFVSRNFVTLIIDNERPAVGDVLTVDIDPADADVSLQWWRAAKDGKLEKLSGETGKTYTVTEDDEGLTLVVSATDNGLTITGKVFSTPTGVVKAPEKDEISRPAKSASHTLSFDVNGGVKLPTKVFTSGSLVNLNDYTPTRFGYVFTGWYADKGLMFKASDLVMDEDATVYAGWRLMYVEELSNPYTDVFETDWFYSSVLTATENGWLNGTAEGVFSPYDKTTRGMIVTMLYRVEGQPLVVGDCPFEDVSHGSYCENAVIWAESVGVVTGYTGKKFGPDDEITREQLAAILYRYQQFKGADVSVGENTNILSYNDAFDIDDYAIPAFQWACGAGVIQGAGGNLNPKATATRSEAAAMLCRVQLGADY